MSQPPRILLGVSGGIAAYKAAEIVRALRKEGAEVRVILTRRAEEFVTPLTLATLSEQEVWRTEFPEEPSPSIGHIDLARWGQALVVAPATANVLARFGRGLGEDLLSTVYLAFQGPVVLAPAMNPKMWDHPETRENVSRLAHRGVVIVDPEEGYMACGDEGAGRLASVPRIIAEALWAARRSEGLAGVKVVVSAGPTHEPLDPVRFIGNLSSGKMGYAMAAAAAARGAEVTLVSGPVSLAPPFGVKVIRVVTALHMEKTVREAAESAEVVVMTAAVADHRPAVLSRDKLSHKDDPFTIEMVPNPDILSTLCRARRTGQIIVGFAAETGEATEKAKAKRLRKGCDLLVANDVTQEGAGFGGDTNIVTVVGPGDACETWPRLAKRQVAERIWDRIEELRRPRAKR